MLELRVLDAASSDVPLVGPYSRFGWNHPGPLLFWVLGVPYHLSGQHSWALLAGAALVNVAAVLTTVGLAWRRGRVLLGALVTLVLVAVQLSMGEVLLRDPWNPWITVLPAALFVVAAWSTLEGDRAGPVLVVLSGSFLAQSHVGFGPLVAVLTTLALVGWWRRRSERSPLLTALVLGILCWLPVGADAVVGEGNTLSLLTHFADGEAGDGTTGFATSLGIAARQLAPWGPWVGGAEPSGSDGGVVPSSLWLLLLPLLAMVGAAVLARRRQDRGALRLQGVVVVAAAVGVLSVARIDGAAYDYLLRWWWPVAVLWWVAAAWPALAALVARVDGAARRRAGLVAAAVPVAVVLVVALALPMGSSDQPVGEWTPLIARVAPAAVDELQAEGIASVCLRRDGPLSGWVKDGISVQLAKANIRVVVPAIHINPNKFGAHRLSGAREVDADLTVLTSDDQLRTGVIGSRLIGLYDGDGDLPTAAVIVEHSESGSCDSRPSRMGA